MRENKIGTGRERHKKEDRTLSDMTRQSMTGQSRAKIRLDLHYIVGI